MHEEPLPGGNSTRISRAGETVRRATGPWTLAVHELLAVLHAAGIDETPEALGFDASGREVLSYLPGEVGHHPLPDWLWQPSVLADAGALLRRIHDASLPLVAGDAVWQLPSRDPVEVICHNDFAPYNLVFTGGRLSGVIDFDTASPGPRIWDLAYLAYRLVPFAEDSGDGAPADERRPARLRALIGGYGGAFDPAEVLRAMSVRLDELASFTDRRASESGREEFSLHAAMYRRDAARMLALAESRGYEGESVPEVPVVPGAVDVVQMPVATPVVVSVEPPLSSDARAIRLRYFDELVSRYNGRPSTAEEIADVDASYPIELLQAPNGLLLLARRGADVLGCAGMRFVTEAATDVSAEPETATRSAAASGDVAAGDMAAGAGAATSARVGEVTRVFVVGSARGLGIARALMAELEAQARSLGLSALRLDTRSDLVEARRLYASIGFVEGPRHNDDPYAEHWFRKELG